MKSVRPAILSLAVMLAISGCSGSLSDSPGASPENQKPKQEAPSPHASPPQQKPKPAVPPPSSGKRPSEKPKRLSKQEVLTFTKKAYEAQNLLRQGTVPVDTVRVTLAPWFTPEYIEHFIKVAGQMNGDQWTDIADSLRGHLIDYTADYTKDVRIRYSKDGKKVWISGMMYWEGQSKVVVTATITHTRDGWRISDIQYD
jgi:hypothetical protein